MDRRREPMTSQRKKTAPPTPRRPRSSSSSRKGLIATEKTKKQSAKKRTVLDNRFHRTPLAELRAGHQCRPYCGALAAATDECLGGSEVRPACRRAVHFFGAKERPARLLEREVRRRACSEPGTLPRPFARPLAQPF